MARQAASPAASGRAGAGAPGGRPRRLALFLKGAVFDFALVLVVSCALVYTVSYGFYSAPDLRGDVAFTAAACAVLLAALYAGSWSRRALPVSALAYALLALGCVAVVSGMSPAPADLFVDGQVNDVAENYAVFGIVLVVVPAIVFLLSRRTWGVAALLFLGALACGSIQFLYREWAVGEPGAVAAVAALVGTGALFVMQGYRQGVMRSRVAKKTSFLGVFAYGVVGAAACLALGAGLFYGVIAGLGITTYDARPFEDFFSRQVVEYDGTFEQQPVYDPDLGTSNLSDEVDTTSDDESGADSGEQEQAGTSTSFISAVVQSLDLDDWQQSLEAIRYQMPPSLAFLLAALPVLAVILVVLARCRWRRWRLKRIERHAAAVRVALLYNFFMKRFERLGVERAEALTPLEFALSSSDELAGFTRNASQADLLGVTLIYQRAMFGAGNVSDDDYRYVRDYYEGFFGNAHRRMGHLKWAFRGFWRI